MKRTFIIIAALALLVSCAQDTEDRTGYVTFGYATSRDVMASISYPVPENLVWTVTATKNNKGPTTGQGTYGEVLLTDELGPFSVGSWTFVFDSDIYHGEVSANIAEGNNRIDVNVSSTGETGTLAFENCNMPADATGVYIYDGEERIFGMGKQYMTEREDGRYGIPAQEFDLEPGIHDVTVTYNGTDMEETFKVRVVGGLVTTVSFGVFEGSPVFRIVVDEQEALVDE